MRFRQSKISGSNRTYPKAVSLFVAHAGNQHQQQRFHRNRRLRLCRSAPCACCLCLVCGNLHLCKKKAKKIQGSGKALYSALEKVLAAQNITNVNACIASPETDDEYLNHNSIQFHQHLGYSMIGEFHKCAYKFGRWYNMVWMEKMIGSHHQEQPAMIPFPEVTKL